MDTTTAQEQDEHAGGFEPPSRAVLLQSSTTEMNTTTAYEQDEHAGGFEPHFPGGEGWPLSLWGKAAWSKLSSNNRTAVRQTRPEGQNKISFSEQELPSMRLR